MHVCRLRTFQYPVGHPKAQLTIVTWALPKALDKSSISGEYYTNCINAVKNADQWLWDIVGVNKKDKKHPDKTAVINLWRQMIRNVELYYSKRINLKTFPYLFSEWLRRKHFETPGRRIGGVKSKRCGDQAVNGWARRIAKAFNIFINSSRRRGRNNLVSLKIDDLVDDYTQLRLDIKRAVSLKRRGEPKYWLRQNELLLMWINLFGKDILGDSFKTGDQYHSLLDLSDDQYCALHDLWLYSTAMCGG